MEEERGITGMVREAEGEREQREGRGPQSWMLLQQRRNHRCDCCVSFCSLVLLNVFPDSAGDSGQPFEQGRQAQGAVRPHDQECAHSSEPTSESQEPSAASAVSWVSGAPQDRSTEAHSIVNLWACPFAPDALAPLRLKQSKGEPGGATECFFASAYFICYQHLQYFQACTFCSQYP